MLKENKVAIDRMRGKLANRNRSESTIKQYTDVLYKFFEEVFPKTLYKEIILDDIDKFIGYLRSEEKKRRDMKLEVGVGRISTVGAGNLKGNTLNKYYSALRVFFRYNGMVDLADNILSAKQPKWNPVVIEIKKLKELINYDAVYNSYKNRRKRKVNEFLVLRDFLLMTFVFSTGCRISESRLLKREDLKLDRNVPVVEFSTPRGGKGDKPRIVELSERWINEFRKFMGMRTDNSDYIFVTKMGAPLTVGGLKNIIRRISEYSGVDIEMISPHKLRHAYAVSLLENDEDLESIRENLGHNDLKTTTVYLSKVRLRKKKVESPYDRWGE